MATKVRKNLKHGTKWKGLRTGTTEFMHDVVHPNKKQFDRLVEIQKEFPELTFQNNGYEYLKLEVKESHKEIISEISKILRDSLLGFRRFHNFKTRKNGEIVIRVDYLWSSSAPTFSGVGYFDLEYWNPKVHASMYYYLQEIITSDSPVSEKAGWMQGLNLSGFAGILSNGNIVDRREFSEATPIQANTKSGIVEPKELKDEKYIFDYSY